MLFTGETERYARKMPESMLSQFHDEIFGDFSLGPDIRNLANFEFNDGSHRKLDCFRMEMKKAHKNGSECRLCSEMKKIIGTSKFCEMTEKIKIFEEKKINLCEISIGCFIMEKYLNTVRHINVFNILVDKVDLNGDDLFDQIV